MRMTTTNDDDNNHNLIKQKKTFCRGLAGSQARWCKKPNHQVPGGTPGQQPGTFSTLLVLVFIKTFINSICKILIKLLDLQILSRPVVEKVSPYQQQPHTRHHQPPDQNPSINLTPKRRTRLRSRSRRFRSRNPTTTTTRRRPRSSTSCHSRIALARKGSAEEDDSFRSSRSSSRRSCSSGKSIIPPHSHSCRIYSCM